MGLEAADPPDTFGFSIPLRAPDVDRSRGVVFRDVQIVPILSVRVEPDLVILPRTGTNTEKTFRVTLVNNAPGPIGGTVELRTPEGWTIEPTSARFACANEDQAAIAEFTVTIPAAFDAPEATVSAVAHVGDRDYTEWMQVISYPHIWRRHLYHPAQTKVKTFQADVAPGLRIGYILGKQDEIPRALDNLGVAYDLLEGDALAHGDLDQYDAIIAGVRAYLFREDLKAHNQRVLDATMRFQNLFNLFWVNFFTTGIDACVAST